MTSNPSRHSLAHRQKVENITTKSTMDTKLYYIVKPFVIFVYFVVDKIYIALQRPSLPPRGHPELVEGKGWQLL